MKHELKVGNLYPAKGGRGSTKYWLVISRNGTACPVLGLDKDYNIVSAHTYASYAMEARTPIGWIDITLLRFEP